MAVITVVARAYAQLTELNSGTFGTHSGEVAEVRS